MSNKDKQHARNETRTQDRTGRKLPEFTGCPECGLVYREGRWMVGTAAPKLKKHLCPACERLNSDNPAGFLHLGGAFFLEHKLEIMRRITNLVEAHRAEHPISRIMKTRSTPDGALITTTDMRLARTLGEAVHHAYQGTIDYKHGGGEGGEPLTVTWKR